MHIELNGKSAFRLGGTALAGFTLGWFFPRIAEPVGLGPQLVIALLFMVMATFLMQQAANRYRDLQGAVYRELNKLRRVYHLSKNLAETSNRFRPWFTELHAFLHGYMAEVGSRDLNAYSESNAAFRNVSYHLYRVPELETHVERALYDDLLRTSAVVAETRQQVKEMLSQKLSGYVWSAVLLQAAGLIAAIVLGGGEGLADRLVVALSVAGVVLTINLLAEMNSLGSRRSDWAKRYVNNIAKLTYRRDVAEA